MDDTTAQLLENYRQLVFLYQEQIAIANKDIYDEQLGEINKLEQKKNSFFSAINQIRLNEGLYNNIVDTYGEIVAHYIENLRELNDTLIQKINILYAEASKNMKQVTTQRKTLQSYGGVNYSDVISYYFDEKK